MDVALVAACAVVTAALVAALFGFPHRRLEATLKLHVERELQRARGDIERDLKNYEARVRIAAEFRLKMLDRMLSDVAAFRGALGHAVGRVQLLMHEVEPKGSTPRAAELFIEAQEAFVALAGAGPYMPPEMRMRATELANEFQNALRDVANWSSLPERDARTARCRETDVMMKDTDARTKTLFSSWQAGEFARFTGMLDELDAAAKPALPPARASNTTTAAVPDAASVAPARQCTAHSSGSIRPD